MLLKTCKLLQIQFKMREIKTMNIDKLQRTSKYAL